MTRIVAVLCLIFPALVWAQAVWEYRDSVDPMGRGVTHYAVVQSVKPITFGSPYGGPQHANLALLASPERAHAVVMLSFERAHFLCRSEGCSVLVRFDEKKAVECPAEPSPSHSTDVLFMTCYRWFVDELRTAKKVRIQASFYQEGALVIEFDVAGLVWADPAPAKPAK